MKKIISKWYIIVAVGFTLFAAFIFLFFGESSIIAVHDNLEIYTAQYQMLKNTDSFFAHNVTIPFLQGTDRDCLPSEFCLISFLYMVMPCYYAYVTGYLLEIVIAMAGAILLAKDFLKKNYSKYKPIVWMAGFAYGILNLFPAYGISFASIPLLIFLVRKIYQKPDWKWYLALFFYPLLSYFSYFGLFILAYMAVAFLWISIKNKKVSGRLLLAIVVLSAGFIVFEYRLFVLMLFGTEVTIRETMEMGSLGAVDVIRTMWDAFVNGIFHADSVHRYLVMPVCLLYFIYLNFSYIRQKKIKEIFRDTYNLLMLILVFNSFVYGIYYCEGFRNLVETLCPPLTGWQFNRTIFFNPFVWYAAFFMVLKRLYDVNKNIGRYLANVLAFAAVLIIVFTDTKYNDFYHTCVAKAYELIKGKEADQLSYEEFFSTALFEEAKKEIGYEGEWAVAYGFHPAILQYNDIATLDGNLGFYPQSYKEAFREVIAPALERVPESKSYYDTWGARAYLYSGTDLSIVGATRSYQVTDNNIYINTDALKELGGKYIFSRIDINNTEQMNLKLCCSLTEEASPYTLYVYKTN